MGYERWRLQRAKVPDDLICKRCDGVLKDPLQCKLCKSYYCQACLQAPAPLPESCEHPESERVEVTKYLKTKVADLMLCCKYKKHGCVHVSRASVIENHERTCQYTSYACTSEACPHASPLEALHTHLNECDFRVVVCPKGCHKKMKANELSTHDCLQWLLTLTASQHDRNRRLASEFEQSRTELDTLKDDFDHYRTATEAEIKDYQVRLKEQQALKKAEQEAVQTRMKGHQETCDSSYSRFQEHTHQRLTTFTSRAEKDMEEFFRQTMETLRGHTTRNKQTLQEYTVKTKADAASFSLASPRKGRSPAKGFSPGKSLNSSLSFSGASRSAL